MKFYRQLGRLMKSGAMIIAVAFLSSACETEKTETLEGNRHKQLSNKMTEIQKQLENGLNSERQNPFVERRFNPYMNGKWIGSAVSYGPYRDGQAPGIKGPSESEIAEDLKIISEYWNFIRVYGSDEDSERILRSIKENNFPLRVMLGVWLENETLFPDRKMENIREVLKAIELCETYSDIIAAVNVGNETQVYWSAHKMEAGNLIKYLRTVRNNIEMPVTTADDYNFWNKPESKSVSEEIDFIAVHMHPLWNGLSVENSIEWMDNILFNDIQMNHPDKPLILAEVGWATDYDESKVGPGQQGTLIKGEVSVEAQGRFLVELAGWINQNQVTTFVFEAFDEPWKGGGPDSSDEEIEKHWGLFYESRVPKDSFKYFLELTENNSATKIKKQ